MTANTPFVGSRSLILWFTCLHPMLDVTDTSYPSELDELVKPAIEPPSCSLHSLRGTDIDTWEGYGGLVRPNASKDNPGSSWLMTLEGGTETALIDSLSIVGGSKE